VRTVRASSERDDFCLRISRVRHLTCALDSQSATQPAPSTASMAGPEKKLAKLEAEQAEHAEADADFLDSLERVTKEFDRVRPPSPNYFPAC
jgi:hypothetical protein